ncbi:MAG: hypothetical protein ACR2KB_13990, partial [Chitinophagaceae bacterium]
MKMKFIYLLFIISISACNENAQVTSVTTTDSTIQTPATPKPDTPVKVKVDKTTQTVAPSKVYSNARF